MLSVSEPEETGSLNVKDIDLFRKKSTVAVAGSELTNVSAIGYLTGANMSFTASDEVFPPLL